ncbi:MAG: sn-glycerol-3-phosphate ABC transporter ATP-binding protein UgpC, partial [Calditrichaeota bacterium]
MAHVTLKNISKYYNKEILAVDNLSIKVEDKEFIVLVGPSGCGKSTTLRMVAGLETISSGELYIGDELVNDVPPKDRGIAMVFQNYALYPHMTVFQNMAFGLKLRKYPKPEINERVQHAAEILEISELLHRKPKELSGGQRQRVAVGRAIVRNPKVFLFDEPLSNLDAKLRVQMRTEISKLHSKLKTTMIYVTHDQVEAMTMGDRIVVMRDGLVLQVDTPLNLYNSPNCKFVAGFIGTPTMNFLKGKISQNNGLWFDNGSTKLHIPKNKEQSLGTYINKDVYFGIRPESIHDANNKDKTDKDISTSLNIDVVEPMGNETFIYA